MAYPDTYTERRQSVTSEVYYNKKYKGKADDNYSSYAGRIFVDSRTGEENSRWKWQVANGLNATTPLEGWKFSLKSRDYRHKLVYPLKSSAPYYAPLNATSYGSYENILNEAGLKAYVAALSESSANSKALSALVESTRDKRAQLKGGAMAGELTETLRLLRNPAKELFGELYSYAAIIYKNRKRLRKLKQKKHLDKALSGLWLAWSFGVTPLLSDIEDILGYIDTRYRAHNTDNDWSFGFGDSETLVSKTSMSQGYSMPHDYVRRRIRGYVSVKYTSKLELETNSVGYAGKTGILDTIDRWGFGPREWFPTLWELTPLSFVFDYFTNIQEIITALSYLNDGILFTNKTVKKTIIEDYPLRYVAGPGIKYSYMSAPSYLEQTLPGSYVMTADYVKRSKFTGLLIPSLDFTIPGLGLKWLNLAALGSTFRKISKDIR